MANHYTSPELARAYSTMLDAAYNSTSGLYLPNGGERRGGSHTAAFWDGVHYRIKSPFNAPGTISAACWKAGRDFNKSIS